MGLFVEGGKAANVNIQRVDFQFFIGMRWRTLGEREKTRQKQEIKREMGDNSRGGRKQPQLDSQLGEFHPKSFFPIQ